MDQVAEVTVLHTLRLTGVVDEQRLSKRVGVASAELSQQLRSLQDAGLVKANTGALAGWSLTPDGRNKGARLLAEELRVTGLRPQVEQAYEDFSLLNGGVLAVCTDWQVRAGTDPMVLNDHNDEKYDEAVLERLEGLHSRSLAMLRTLASTLERFTTYAPRLSKALATARNGALDWVTKPGIDSYHTVWFELHEDLLATLGRNRSDESAGRNARNPV
ncbi:MAG: transcriptional regulator [Microthrixaceae bacterium]